METTHSNLKVYLLSSLIVILIQLSCMNSELHESSSDKRQAEDTGYKLVWNDEFNYEGLPDSTKWIYDTEGNEVGWGNHEAQYYSKARTKNAKAENGVLQITAHKEDLGGKKYTSARLVSKADWKYGKLEVNAKLPGGTGTWTAIWMMPGGWSFNDGNWPAVGEIDIMEHVGHETGIIHSSAHSTDYQWQKQTQKSATLHIPDVTEQFHSYILEWTPKVLRTYVDDSLCFEYENEGLGETKWPYNKPFYLILNIAVGGAWGSVKGIDDEAFPQTMEVEYVRIFQKNQ